MRAACDVFVARLALWTQSRLQVEATLALCYVEGVLQGVICLFWVAFFVRRDLVADTRNWLPCSADSQQLPRVEAWLRLGARRKSSDGGNCRFDAAGAEANPGSVDPFHVVGGPSHGFSLGPLEHFAFGPRPCHRAGVAGFSSMVCVPFHGGRLNQPFAAKRDAGIFLEIPASSGTGDGFSVFRLGVTSTALGAVHTGRVAYRRLRPGAPGRYLRGGAHVPIRRSRGAARRDDPCSKPRVLFQPAVRDRSGSAIDRARGRSHRSKASSWWKDFEL